MKFLLRILRVPRQAIKGTHFQNNYVLILAYRLLMFLLTGLRKDYHVNFRGMELVAEGGDITILPTLIDETFEEEEIEWFLARIREDRGNLLFIDIGANIGIYSLLALKNKIGVTVAAVEPDKRNLERFKRNVSTYIHTPQLSIFECAIGITDPESLSGLTRNFLQDQNGGTSRFAGLNETFENQILTQVDVLSLHTLTGKMMLDKFDDVIIKIDVEGFEPEVLQSGLDSILEYLPTILVEYTNSPKRLDMSNWDNELLSVLFSKYSTVMAMGSTGMKYLEDPSDLKDYSENEVLNLVFDIKT